MIGKSDKGGPQHREPSHSVWEKDTETVNPSLDDAMKEKHKGKLTHLGSSCYLSWVKMTTTFAFIESSWYVMFKWNVQYSIRSRHLYIEAVVKVCTSIQMKQKKPQESSYYIKMRSRPE